MKRLINFNAGPATLPAEVLQQMADATIAYGNTGMSILELPHRSKAFFEIIDESKHLVRTLCGIGNDYEVMWLHGGGRMQFCMAPMNFLAPHKVAAFIDTGHWATEAAEYAAYYGQTETICSSVDTGYSTLPDWPAVMPENAAYVHLTTNNTIYGTQWQDVPATQVPLIADMSSDILSRAHNYNRYAMFYATAQKNLGMPGVALAVVHRNLLANAVRPVPPMLSYAAQAKENSVVNTANVPGIYAALLMLRWTMKQGMAHIEADNRLKADMLYNQLDNSNVFLPRVTEKAHRSMVNVCFTARAAADEAAFLSVCKQYGIEGISGHRYTGGFRVSLYNAVPVQHVQTLVAVMQQFEQSR